MKYLLNNPVFLLFLLLIIDNYENKEVLAEGFKMKSKKSVNYFNPEKSKVYNIGHRGTGKNYSYNLYPENSVKSFLQAYKEGANGIELDVRITKDKKLILMHDDDLKKTTNGSGCVSENNYEEIIKFNAISKSTKGYIDKIMLLENALDAIKSKGIIDIEIKTKTKCQNELKFIEIERKKLLTKKVLETVYKLELESKVIITSFDKDVLDYLVELDSNIYTGYLVKSLKSCINIAVNSGYKSVAVKNSSLINKEFINNSKSQGLHVYVWTVNNEKDMKRLIKLGVNGIITDEPNLLNSILNDS